MKYVPEDTSVTFSEIPDEISLCINISGCPCNCPGCHSQYLSKDIGEVLDEKAADALIKTHSGVSCICFMGGDGWRRELNHLISHVRKVHPHLKIAWYSGRSVISPDINIKNLDYVKVGPYMIEKGPLNKETTNQRLYYIDHTSHDKLIDITYKFWKKQTL